MSALLALSGCLYIDADFHAERQAELGGDSTTTSTTTTPVAPVLEGVDPAYGTTAGSTTVTVIGGPFDPGDSTLEVRFGGVVAAVRSVDAGSLLVDTPAAASAGAVDVTVTTKGGAATRPAAFTYWPDATGKVGATGELVWFEYVGGAWGVEEGSGYGRATLRFTEPVDFQYYKFWAPSLDTCVHLSYEVPEYTYVPNTVSIDALGGTSTWSAPSATISLGWNQADVRFTDYDLDPAQVIPGEAYDLRLQGTLGIPEVNLEAVFRVPDAFVVTSPWITGATAPDITADHHFEWTTGEEGDAILLQVGMLSDDQTAFEEEVWCAVRDVGSFWMPAEQWTAWAANRQVHVLVGRYNSATGLIPWNQGRIAVASQIWYYGVARSR